MSQNSDLFIININTPSNTSIDFELNEVQHNLNCDCFICFFELNDKNDIIILNCCKQKLHKKCFFNTILFINTKCPICRGKNIEIKNYLTINDIVIFYNKLELEQKEKFINNIQQIILNNYNNKITHDENYNIELVSLYLTIKKLYFADYRKSLIKIILLIIIIFICVLVVIILRK